VRGEDEIGILAKIFNKLLEQIEEKDRNLSDMNTQLEEKVSSRTQELISTNKNLKHQIEKRELAEKKLEVRNTELERSNSDLQQFAYVASHDLQEPLRMISSFTQLLEMKYKGKLGSDADEYIHFITDGASRMKTLIDDLLAFSRVTSKAKEFVLCDLKKILDTVKINLTETLRVSKGNIIVEKELPVIYADETQMLQLFQNLFTNAIKFQPPGQIPEITINVEERPNEWLFQVRDNGIGINKEFSKKIFVIFQRLHTQKKYPGSGIGLSICKKIVERHKGKIWFESIEGKGTTFFFTISKELSNKEEYGN
jgi:light-regulated signal transduction histidine kinase (bacteriophytochrome)